MTVTNRGTNQYPKKWCINGGLYPGGKIIDADKHIHCT